MKRPFPIKNTFMILFIGLVIIMGIIFALLVESDSHTITPTERVRIMTDDGPVVFRVAIADDAYKRMHGLMGVEELADDEGMLFLFNDQSVRTFWMKDTLIGLDMIFIDEGRIVSIRRRAKPCTKDPCPTYSSGASAQLVLEIKGGLADEKNINVGDAFLTSS